VREEVLKFMKWVTEYFTLLYICKDGRLQQSREDEVNPLKFLEAISAFLLYNLRQGSGEPQQSSYFEGTVVCLDTMLQLLNRLYGDRPEAFSNLEIVSILIRKVCHLAYEQDLRKKLAVTFALPPLLRELPALAIRRHSDHILDALCQILNTSPELSVPAAQREFQATLELLFEKIGLFSPALLQSRDPGDQALFDGVMAKVFQHLYSLKAPAREIAARMLEHVAAKARVPVARLAERVPHSPGASAAGSQAQAEPIPWRQHIWQEVQRMAALILPALRGGYSKVEPLIAHTEALRFALKHGITPTSFDQGGGPTLLGVAELLLRVLEVEAERYDQRAEEPDPQASRRTPGVESPSSCAQKYMKLERLYISQNQDYDPYSHTQHPHELLTMQHFEVTQQAKRERERQQDEALDSCTFRQLELFGAAASNFTSFESFDPQAAEGRLPEPERESVRAAVGERYRSFIQRLCGSPGMGARPSDIAYDYVSHLYVLYPNVRQRTELICRCLEVLCDIVTHPSLDPYLRERQQAYFGPQQPTESRSQDPSSRRPDQGDRPGASVLASRLDFYAVEIKAKIIAIYFKFFQREEENILGTARACLCRLLNEAPHHAEALPNLILKECVRPALNVLSQPPAHSPRAFKHLAMLIEVLHVCFNDQLAQHLVNACAQRQAAVGAGYQGQGQVPPPGQPVDGAAGGAGASAAAGRAGAGAAGGTDPVIAAAEREREGQRDRERRVVAQYNLEKVGSLETVKHIIQILHLLPTPVPGARDLMLTCIQGIPEFELRASRELETRHVPLEEGWQLRGLELRPLRVRFGVLQSDFRDGLAKFFNRNPVECVAMLRDRPAMVPLTLAVMKMPGSHTVRERIAREIDQTIRPRLRATPRMPNRSAGDERRAPSPLLDHLLGVRLVWTLTKFNPSFLCQPQHGDVLESLRWRWVKLSELSVDNVPAPALSREHPEAITDLKNLYRKILKCLLAYCRSDRSDKQVLFDLLKGFSYQPIIDLTPLLKFFTVEVPTTFPRRRQAGIMEAALNKVEASRGTHEQRYAMFEFAFMPLALSCAESQERFEELFPRSTLELFLSTFFRLAPQEDGERARKAKWRYIQMALEPSSQVGYEQFHVELIKALCVILRRIRSSDVGRLEACLGLGRERYCKQIIEFLREFAGKGVDGPTREWACYALTLLCLQIQNFVSGRPGQVDEGQGHDPARMEELARDAEQCASWVLPLMLQQSHDGASKGLVGKTISSLIKFFESWGPQQGRVSEHVRRSLSAALVDADGHEHQRADLCALVVQNAGLLYPYHEDLRGHLYELIRLSGRPQSPASVERIIKAAETVTSWCRTSVRESEQGQREKLGQESAAVSRERTESLKYCRLIFGHLMDLVRGSVALQAQGKSLTATELESLLTDVLRVMKTIFEIHPAGALDPPTDTRQGGIEARDAPLPLRLFQLNAAYLMAEYGDIHQDPAMLNHALWTLQQVRSSDDARCLLLALRLVRALVRKVMDPRTASEEQLQLLVRRLEEGISQDLQAS